jgi:hypothetical protein
MRDKYRLSIKKTTSGQAAKKVKKYKLDDQLQFLEPRLQGRDTSGNIKDVVGNEDVNIFIKNAAIQRDKRVNKIVSDGDKQLKIVKQTMRSEPIKILNIGLLDTLNRSKVRETFFRRPKTNVTEAEASQSNPVDEFLAGLSPTLKTFTPYYLDLVKSKIFSIVQEHEKKMILDEEQ